MLSDNHVLMVLPVGQQQPDFFTVGFGNNLCLPQRSFSFGGLFGQDMAGA